MPTSLPNLNVLGICGSLRRASLNLMALKLAGELMPTGMSLHITNLIGLPIYNLDLQEEGWPKPVIELRNETYAADAVLFAAPEYNGTISAPLKNAIDWLSRFKDPRPFDNKPCAVLSASPGHIGGARVQYDVRRSLGLIGALFLPQPEVFIGKAHEKFDAKGDFSDSEGRELLAQQMVAFQDWISRIKRAFE